MQPRGSAPRSGRCRPGTMSPSRRWTSTSAASRGAARGRPPVHATEAPAVRIGKIVPRLMRRHVALTALLVAAPYAGSLAGTYFLILAYRSATGETPLRTFHLFWLGILLFLVPTTYRLLGFAASRGERIALVAATGAFLFIPKVLRAPDGPVYFDELAHWRQTETISESGRLF